jgi:hypothetical protein
MRSHRRHGRSYHPASWRHAFVLESKQLAAHGVVAVSLKSQAAHGARVVTVLDDDADEKHNRQLWCAVINQAIEDAMSKRTSSNASMSRQLRNNQQSALRWLLDGGKDFAAVCALAGLDPEAVRDRLKHMPGVAKMFSKNAPDQSFPSAQEIT